jgi:hypothetical protein
MSQLEIANISNPLYSYQFPALTAGTVTTTNVTAQYLLLSLKNFFPQSSKIVGIVRTTVGGTVGQPYLGINANNINSTADGYLPLLTLRSSTNADTSVYTLYWQNEVVQSQIASVLKC